MYLQLRFCVSYVLAGFRTLNDLENLKLHTLNPQTLFYCSRLKKIELTQRHLADHRLSIHRPSIKETGHANNSPTMQFSAGISRKYSVRILYAIIECVRDFQNNALWDTHLHALLVWSLAYLCCQ